MSTNLNLPDPDSFDIDDIPAVISKLSACQSQLASRLMMEKKSPEEDDQLLTVPQVCEILGVKKSWIYAHLKNLPFTRQVCRGRVRFSKRGLHVWISKRR
jgi:excisionase family DNA binding protein